MQNWQVNKMGQSTIVWYNMDISPLDASLNRIHYTGNEFNHGIIREHWQMANTLTLVKKS